jgi:hypothetical protein
MREIDSLSETPTKSKRFSFGEFLDEAIDEFTRWWDKVWHLDPSDRRTYSRP